MKKSSITLRDFSSKLGSLFGFLFSGLIMIIGFLIATPFFLLSILINWIKMSIGFAFFWLIAYIVYDSVILNSSNLDIHPFNNTVILSIMGLALVASIFVTIADIKD